MGRVDMLLQRLEVGQPRRQYERGLAVDERALAGERQKRLGDGRKAHRPVETAAAEQRDFVARFPCEDAIAVIFQLMQPLTAGRYLGVERGELRLDEGRRYDLPPRFAFGCAFDFAFGFAVTARVFRAEVFF